MRGRETGEAGFSLIEALAAVAIMAAILMAIGSVAGQWLPNWRRGFNDVQQAGLLDLGVERITSDVAAAEYVSTDAQLAAPFFEGGPSSVMFVRPAIGPNARAELEIVWIHEVEAAEGAQMVRERASFAPAQPGAVKPALAFHDPVVLARPPFRLAFAYAGPDRAWLESWRGAAKLPLAFRVSVRETRTGRVLAASTAVGLHVTAPAPSPTQASAADDINGEAAAK